MAGPTTFARIKAGVLAVAARVPPGRVVTHGLIARDLKVAPRQVASILATLDEAERDSVPWHRVVAEGGAIGRHKRRDDQMARLRVEGVPVAPAGMVEEMAVRAITDLAAPIEAIKSAKSDGPRGRSRGMKGRPATTT